MGKFSKNEFVVRPHEAWARFRFGVIGRLLAAPPPKGELAAELTELGKQLWKHPITGEPTPFGVSTIERWYYRALGSRADPVGVLARKVRADSGRERKMSEGLGSAVIAQYKAHPSWSYKLHCDNLAELAVVHPELGACPSYPTVRRYLKARACIKTRRRGSPFRPGQARAAERLEQRETRSFEVDHVHALWHADFHFGSRKITTSEGEWVRPVLLGILDDRSRLVCHAQWYFAESSENFAHGFCQAIQKRGIPRSLLTDNGSAFLACESREGLIRLGIVHETTLPYSPHQNAKQEVFWAQVEGRLVAMLEGVAELTLAQLNEATLAWAEGEYHRTVHSETIQTPIERLLAGPNVGRPSPPSEELRSAFTAEVRRTQRRSDGTITIEGVRFEIPSRFRHLPRVSVRFASWDLGRALLVDERRGAVVATLSPLDRSANADGRRRFLAPTRPFPPAEPAPTGMAPLLERLIAEQAATGLPPAYLPKDDHTPEPKPDNSKPIDGTANDVEGAVDPKEGKS